MNFSKEELIRFARQYGAFQKKCKHVASIFAKYDSVYKDIYYGWELDYNEADQKLHISNDVDIYNGGCWIDRVMLSLPVEVLSYTDEQIEAYAYLRFGCNS